MSKILLIEPDKMLRQAFGVALFPEHQVVQAIDAIPATMPSDADAVIVDVAALRMKKLLSDRAVRVVEACKLPIVWVGDESGEAAPRRKQIVRLCGPVVKDTLCHALAQCLEESGRSKPNAATSAKPAGATRTRPKERRGGNKVAGAPRTYIDLVDVVEVSSETDGVKAWRE
jgi:hypothetical protein